MPEALGVLVGIPVALVIVGALAYILGFIVSMIITMVYVPIEAIEHHQQAKHHPHRPVAAR